MAQAIPKEIREEVLKRIKEDGIPAAQVARERGLKDSTVYTWLGRKAEGEPGLRELQKLRRENQTLKYLLGELTAELRKPKKGAR